jgi:undecaprenyl diphosphate synthase
MPPTPNRFAKSAPRDKKSTRVMHAETQAESPLPLQHVAIIMDGNRRWADTKHLPRVLGHKEGVKSLKRLVRHVGALGLKYLTVYAFSSENWQRTQEEVSYLFELFVNVLNDELEELCKNEVRLTFIGHLDPLPEKLKKKMVNAMSSTSSNTGLSLQVAINYGSRLEITEAIKKISTDVAQGKLRAEDITEELVSANLFTSELPDPELMIRTGGEMRLSNYLLWQSAYAELYVTSVLWPDFSPDEFDKAIVEFQIRHRRYGGD